MKVKRMLVSVALASSLVAGGGAALVSTASAAPITCQGNFSPVKESGGGGWTCAQNNTGKTNDGPVRSKGNPHYKSPGN